MDKHSLYGFEKRITERFIYEFYPNRGDFGWDKIDSFRDKYGYWTVYTLVSHKTHIVIMTKGPFPKKPQKERFAITEKGLLIYDFGGYEEWEKYNSKRIRFIKSEPFRNKLTLIVSLVGAFIALTSVYISYLNYRDSNAERERLKALEQLVKVQQMKIISLPDSMYQVLSNAPQKDESNMPPK